MAFKIAGSMAIQEGCKKAKPVLMEPMMKVEVVVPDEYLGDVMGDINARRGNIEKMGQRKDAHTLNAIVPLAKMFGYATDETEECMPLTVVLAHNLNKKLSDLRRDGTLWWARPDTKTQVKLLFLHDFTFKFRQN